MPSLRILRTFLAVAAEGSFTAAGQRVALTQVAVGLQMRTLENDLKRKLFARQGKLVTLNEQGRALVPIATQLVALYEQAKHGTRADAPLAGTVQFGSIVSALSQLVRATLELKRHHPAVDLHVVSGKSNRLIAQVENHELDAAVVVHNPAIKRPSLVWTPLYAEPMVLLAPRAARPRRPPTWWSAIPSSASTAPSTRASWWSARCVACAPSPRSSWSSTPSRPSWSWCATAWAWPCCPIWRGMAGRATRACACCPLPRPPRAGRSPWCSCAAARAEIITAVGQQFVAALAVPA